jgi:hypothetical protein
MITNLRKSLKLTERSRDVRGKSEWGLHTKTEKWCVIMVLCDNIFVIYFWTLSISQSQCPRGLGRGCAAARLLGLRVRNPPRAWMSVCCECCMLSGRGPYVGMITRLEELYWVWCVWVWSWSLYNEEAVANQGLLRHGKISTSLTSCIVYDFMTEKWWVGKSLEGSGRHLIQIIFRNFSVGTV